MRCSTATTRSCRGSCCAPRSPSFCSICLPISPMCWLIRGCANDRRHPRHRRCGCRGAAVAARYASADGVPLGLLSGYFGGLADGVLMRVIDAMLAIPFLILAIALAAFLGPNLTNAMIAIGVSQTPVFTRLTRGQVLAVRHEDFIDAARA